MNEGGKQKGELDEKPDPSATWKGGGSDLGSS